MTKIIQKTLYIFLFVLFLIVGLFFRFPIFTAFDDYLREKIIYPNVHSQNQEDFVVLVVTDETIKQIGEWPIDRIVYSQLINDYLIDSKLIVFDFLFINSLSQKGDNAFISSLENNDNVILPYVDDFDGQLLTLPYSPFLVANPEIGYINYLEDEDGFTRNYTLEATKDGVIRNSLIKTSLIKLGYQIKYTENGMIITKNNESVSILNTNANSKEFFVLPTDLSQVEVIELSSVFKDNFNKSVFKDKIVLLGGSFTGASDTINQPKGAITGIHFILNAFNTIFVGKQPQYVDTWLTFIVVSLLLSLLYYLSDKSKILSTSILYGLSLIVTVAIFYLLNKFLIISFNFSFILIAILVTYFVDIISRLKIKDKVILEAETSLERILEMSDTRSKVDNYKTYIEDLKRSFLDENSFHVVESVASSSDTLLKEITNEEKVLDLFFAKNFIIIPIYTREEYDKFQFTILMYKGSFKNKKFKSSVNYVSSLLVTAYTFFRFDEELRNKNKLTMGVFESMIFAVDAKDSITSNHSKRVAVFAVKIGTWLDFSKDKLDKLYFAGLVHDIGKIGIPDEVLNKPSFFNKYDLSIMKKHPEIGAQMLNNLDLDDDITTSIFHHHERLDGKGYPIGLKGNQISEFARIIKVADVYDALTSKRQYKDEWELNKVCNIFYTGMGTEFDEHIVKVVLDNIKPNNWIPPNQLKQESNFTPLEEKTRVALNYLLEKIHQSYKLVDYFSSKSSEINQIKTDGNLTIYDINNFDYFGFITMGDNMHNRSWERSGSQFLIYDDDKEISIYLNNSFRGFENVYFIFLRGYLNCTLFELNENNRRNLENSLNNINLVPIVSNDSIKIYDRGKYINVFVERDGKSYFSLLSKYYL